MTINSNQQKAIHIHLPMNHPRPVYLHHKSVPVFSRIFLFPLPLFTMFAVPSLVVQSRLLQRLKVTVTVLEPWHPPCVSPIVFPVLLFEESCGDIKQKENGPKVSLFHVPKNRLDEWRHAIGNNKLKSTSRLCDARFSSHAFIKGKTIGGHFFP